MCQLCDLCSASDLEIILLHGSDDADLLIGNSLVNTILGNGGDDSLSGHGGNDSIYGNSGNDSILGGLGDDYLVGDTVLDPDTETSDDTLRGGSGDDTLFGGRGNDLLFGGTGNDLIYGGSGDDKIRGNSGDDYLLGNDGSDLLIGGTGNDTLYGGNGILSFGDASDTLNGGSGQDLIVGDIGNDVLIGGTEADRFSFAGAREFASAMLGIDTIKDFSSEEDKIVLDNTVFSSLNSNMNDVIDTNEFTVVTDDELATTAEELIVYSSASGKLFYNKNGANSGFGDGGQFAILNGTPELTAENIEIV